MTAKELNSTHNKQFFNLKVTPRRFYMTSPSVLLFVLYLAIHEPYSIPPNNRNVLILKLVNTFFTDIVMPLSIPHGRLRQAFMKYGQVSACTVEIICSCLWLGIHRTSIIENLGRIKRSPPFKRHTKIFLWRM